MKKYFLIGIIMAIVPNICFGYSARFTQLAREKERKMAELEKCMGSTKGLKIAGISTLGLSAVGVAANVVEAKKIKDYDSSIESTTQQIEKTKTETEKKSKELAQIQNEKINKATVNTPTQETQQDCISRIDQEIASGVPAKYQNYVNDVTQRLNFYLDQPAGEAGGLTWYGYTITCKEGQKLRDCAGADQFFNNISGIILKARIQNGECGKSFEIQEPIVSSGANNTNENNSASGVNNGNSNNATNGSNSGTASSNNTNLPPYVANNSSSTYTGSDKPTTTISTESQIAKSVEPFTQKPAEQKAGEINQTDKLWAVQCEDRGGTWDPTRHNDEDDTIPGVCVLPEMVVSTSAPSGAPKVTDPHKMLQNVIAQDIASINETPGKLGDKVYIHGYTISNIQHLSLHDNLYNAIEEFKNRCYDNAGDPDDAYSVIVGIDEDALGDDSDEKYTENTVLPNLQQHIVSRCECNDYGWERQGNKCVKK